MATLDKNLLLEMFRKMEEIRRMDLKIAQLVKKGKVPGMTHFSVGEEAANVGAMLALNEDDLLTSNHRGHGQAIAKGINLNEMMAEILGKYTGTCKGKGGSMHIADLDAGKPYRIGNPTCMLRIDRKSTRLNSSHRSISYAVFC